MDYAQLSGNRRNAQYPRPGKTAAVLMNGEFRIRIKARRRCSKRLIYAWLAKAAAECPS
jgi:hypothetical protein